MNEIIATTNLHGLVSLMRDAGDDGSHTHQPGPTVPKWVSDAVPCTHPGCRCLVRWLVRDGQAAWLAVATSK